MFMGEFRHSIDAKGRLTIPSKIRNQCQGSIFVARGFDGINIPTNLRTLAGLEKECVIIGAGNHGEIWSQEKWDQYYNDNQDGYDDILESLDDFSL